MVQQLGPMDIGWALSHRELSQFAGCGNRGVFLLRLQFSGIEEFAVAGGRRDGEKMLPFRRRALSGRFDWSREMIGRLACVTVGFAGRLRVRVLSSGEV